MYSSDDISECTWTDLKTNGKIIWNRENGVNTLLFAIRYELQKFILSLVVWLFLVCFLFLGWARHIFGAFKLLVVHSVDQILFKNFCEIRWLWFRWLLWAFAFHSYSFFRRVTGNFQILQYVSRSCRWLGCWNSTLCSILWFDRCPSSNLISSCWRPILSFGYYFLAGLFLLICCYNYTIRIFILVPDISIGIIFLHCTKWFPWRWRSSLSFFLRKFAIICSLLLMDLYIIFHVLIILIEAAKHYYKLIRIELFKY